MTGGSWGIGRAIVERLGRGGADVVLSYVQDEGAGRDVQAAVAESGSRAEVVQPDLGRLEDIRALFDQVQRQMDGFDILVNNAGADIEARIAEATEEDYDQVMTINAKGTFFAMQEAARRMRDGERIINISSVNTIFPQPGIGIYAASKGAVEQFARVAARELAGRGITVNIVSPGTTDTDMFHTWNSPQAVEQLTALTPLGRIGEPADVADVVGFLAGPDARWLTGEHLHASGGLPMGCP
ncbi:MAG: SDR family oxidoreductase [Nocardioidaceae bacterium]